MIFASIDLNRSILEEFFESLRDIKNSKFDGVEISLWEDMGAFAERVKCALEQEGLKSNVHGDIMRINEGIDCCRFKLVSGLDFSKRINSNFFISHPIKPYFQSLHLSKRLFNEFKGKFLVENVRGIKLEQIISLDNPMVLDIGNLMKNDDTLRLDKYPDVCWVHIHDFKNGEDHLPLGEGRLDFKELVKQFIPLNFTLELGRDFRRWPLLREGYRKSIDFLNNTLMYNRSYGKNIRLKHLLSLVGNRTFTKAIELGCAEGYLIHNLPAKIKEGYDLKPQPVFNDISYFTGDITQYPLSSADIIVCSEVIEHISEDKKVIKKINQALKPGGLIFLSTINKNTLEDKSEIDKERGHLRRYGPELQQIMAEAGFTSLAFYPFRSDHYYGAKKCLTEYSSTKDIREGQNFASGWIYFGVKRE